MSHRAGYDLTNVYEKVYAMTSHPFFTIHRPQLTLFDYVHKKPNSSPFARVYLIPTSIPSISLVFCLI
jgi:hypothetical protein